jgi:thioredoxin-like negative regulator of GroEL
VAAVNADKESSLAKEFKVTSYPTILVFGAGKAHSQPEKYSGALKAKDIVNFGLSKLPSFVTGVRKSTYNE